VRRLAAATFLLAALVAVAGCGDGSEQRAPAPPATGAASVSHARPPAHAASRARLTDWPLFGLTPSRTSATDRPTGITRANAAHLHLRRVQVPGTVDSTPIVLHGVAYATTTYGRTVAVSLATGRLRWTFTPPGYRGWAGTGQITNASPAADPSGTAIFAASPDGRIHKLAVSDGHEEHGFPVAITRDPTHEKLTSSLNIDGANVIETTGGYLGDAPPYQGHVVAIDRASGAIRGVFNSLCSNRHELIQPSSCGSSDSAIWGRAGAVVLPGSSDLLVATSNGPFDGRTDWADSVLRLDGSARRLKTHWTPAQQAAYEQGDVDVGSTSPAVLGGGLVMQSGKDAQLHLLALRRLSGIHGAAGARLGGDLQVLPAPGGQMMFTAPAVWHHRGHTTMIATTGGATAAYAVRHHRLVRIWSTSHAGTSPVVAGGLLYVYDPTGGGLRILLPSSGRQVAQLPAGSGHWNSPVVADGHIVLSEGDANDHQTSGGVLDIWSR
jgi:outer membrane protein assembly factor BamB